MCLALFKCSLYLTIYDIDKTPKYSICEYSYKCRHILIILANYRAFMFVDVTVLFLLLVHDI